MEMTPRSTLTDFLVLHEINRTQVTVTWAAGGTSGHVTGVPRVIGDAVAFNFPMCERTQGETFVPLAHVVQWGNVRPPERRLSSVDSSIAESSAWSAS